MQVAVLPLAACSTVCVHVLCLLPAASGMHTVSLHRAYWNWGEPLRSLYLLLCRTSGSTWTTSPLPTCTCACLKVRLWCPAVQLHAPPCAALPLPGCLHRAPTALCSACMDAAALSSCSQGAGHASRKAHRCACCWLNQTPGAQCAGKTMHDIPKDTLEDACQLVKANSIQAGSGWRSWSLENAVAGRCMQLQPEQLACSTFALRRAIQQLQPPPHMWLLCSRRATR